VFGRAAASIFRQPSLAPLREPPEVQVKVVAWWFTGSTRESLALAALMGAAGVGAVASEAHANTQPEAATEENARGNPLLELLEFEVQVLHTSSPPFSLGWPPPVSLGRKDWSGPAAEGTSDSLPVRGSPGGKRPGTLGGLPEQFRGEAYRHRVEARPVPGVGPSSQERSGDARSTTSPVVAEARSPLTPESGPPVRRRWTSPGGHRRCRK